MPAITDQAAVVYSDFNTPGVSSSGEKEPVKREIRALWSMVDTTLSTFGVAGAVEVSKATRAALDADLAHDADTLAIVYGDPTSSNNGIYVKSGVSGAGIWTLTNIALPAGFADQLADALSRLEELDAAVEIAQIAASSASGNAALATQRKNEAEAARDVALSILPAGAATGTQPTKAALDAAVSGLADGAWMVLEDETNEGAPALYVVESGAIVGDPAVFLRRDALEPGAPQDEGARDDGVVDNRIPFELLIGGLSGSEMIRVPAIEGGQYYFGDFTNVTSFTSGLTFDVDPGLVFSCPLGKWLGQSEMRVTRPLRFDVVTGGVGDYQFILGPSALRTPVEKEQYLGSGDADWSVTSVVDCTTELTAHRAYPGLPLVSGAFTASGVSFVEMTMAGSYAHCATCVCLPGDEVHAAVTDVATAAPFSFLVILKGGFLLTYQAQGLSAAISWGNSVTGASGGITYTGYSLHESYNAAKSVLGVRVLGPRSLQILHNGYPVHTFWDTGADILEVGFGAGVNSNAGTTRFSNWTRVKGKRLANQKPSRGLICGDSKTDDSVMGSWPMFLGEAGETAGGLRILSINNIAVSGHNTAQQRAAVAALGSLAGYQFACVDIGTNDIQGNVPLNTSVTEFTALLDLLAGLRVTVAIPALWYGQAQTPGGDLGGDALRYAEGAALRQAYKAICAGRSNVKVFEYDEMGPILSDWLAGFPNATIAPMVFDNIHPDFVARRLMGYAHAKALLGLNSPEPAKTYPPSAFHSSWFAANYSARASNDPSYEIDKIGGAGLSGWLSIDAALPAAGTTMATLPRILWPARAVEALCPCYDNTGTPVYLGVCPVRISTAGVITAAAAPPATSKFIRLDPLSFALAAS